TCTRRDSTRNPANSSVSRSGGERYGASGEAWMTVLSSVTTRTTACCALAYAPRFGPEYFSAGFPLRETTRRLVCFASWSAASATCWLKSAWIRRVVRTPTITANPSRITSVSAAEPPASRQRIGSRLYAEDVARAADCMKEPWFATGFELSAEVGDEHLDRVRDGEGVVAPHLVEQALTRDHEPLVAHQVLEQLELALGQVDRALPTRD